MQQSYDFSVPRTGPAAEVTQSLNNLPPNSYNSHFNAYSEYATLTNNTSGNSVSGAFDDGYLNDTSHSMYLSHASSTSPGVYSSSTSTGTGTAPFRYNPNPSNNANTAGHQSSSVQQTVSGGVGSSVNSSVSKNALLSIVEQQRLQIQQLQSQQMQYQQSIYQPQSQPQSQSSQQLLYQSPQQYQQQQQQQLNQKGHSKGSRK